MSKLTRLRHRKWRAYSYAATAAAIHVTGIIKVGDVDLTADYRTIKLEEIGRALKLDKTTDKIPAPACLLVNWPIMAQVTIGAPPDWFENESMAELLVEGDPIGQHLMRKHWPEIERVAEALLLKGRLSEIEALAMLNL